MRAIFRQDSVHLGPLLDRLPETFSTQPASHVVGRVGLPALVNGKHAAGSRLEPARPLHQEGAMGPAEPRQAVLVAPGGGEDEVPWGEGGVRAPSRGFGTEEEEQKVSYCHPSLSNTPPSLCKKDNF